jgi:hypothetical protein
MCARVSKLPAGDERRVLDGNLVRDLDRLRWFLDGLAAGLLDRVDDHDLLFFVSDVHQAPMNA